MAKKEKRKVYFKPAKILLVEDNLMNQELAVSLLNSVGLTTMIANNGKEDGTFGEGAGDGFARPEELFIEVELVLASS